MDTSLYQSVIAGGSKNQIKPAPHAEPKTPDEIYREILKSQEVGK